MSSSGPHFQNHQAGCSADHCGAGAPIAQFQELVDIESARTIMMMSQSSSSLTTEEAGVRHIADACDTAPCPAPDMDACTTPGPRTPAKKASKVSLLCDEGSLSGCFTVGEGTALHSWRRQS